MIADKGRQDKFKTVKQRLSAIRLVIKKDLKDSRLPTMDDAHQFIATSREMDRLCQNEWRAAMDHYTDQLEQFETAMKSGDLQAIEDTFHELIESKNACHKEFRKR